MFFNRKSEPVTAPARVETLEWEQPNRRSQSTRIIVRSWFIRTTPSLKYPSGCKVELTFEGYARLGTTPNVPVYGEISIPIDSEPAGHLSDRWKNVPECVDGHAYLSLEAVGAPGLFVTLYCTAEALEWVSRVFVAGFAVVGSNAALDLHFTYPDDKGIDFWSEQWQKETLQVAQWDVRASAERTDG